jgi:hypothetical protein
VRPVVHHTNPHHDAAEAHGDNDEHNDGKIILTT